VRWYVAYPLSPRHLEPSKVCRSFDRWALTLLPFLEKTFRQQVGKSWRMDGRIP
jgi:transposase-like protein